MTLGSLFDGSGGFPLAGVMAGIKPVWSSEIEPYPLKVTAARFPDVKQLGDVTKINGAEVEPVDIVTFGSPCQDLSVAGKQRGIHDGERSNLFFEAIRIIKEMRENDERAGRSNVDIRPRFAVWENVPGAFSSNKGADFQAVLQALASVRENGVSIPRPKKWGGSGCVVGNGWSIAWRVYDAQYWGVPQRRKRIYLVADFGSERAGEILFKSEGVCGDSAQSGAAREGTAADAERSIGRSSGVRCLNPWDCQTKRQYDINGCYATLNANSGGGGRCDGVVYEPKSLMEENWAESDIKNALRANASKSGSCVVEPVASFMGGQGAKAGGIAYSDDGTTPTLKASPSGSNTVPDVCYALQGNGIDRADTAGCNGCGWRTDEMYTLNTVDRPAVVFQQNQREEVRNMGEQAGALTAQPGVHNQNYVCYPRVARSLCARHDSSPCVDRGQNVVCYGVDCRNATLDEEKTHTLQAKASLNCTPSVVYPINTMVATRHNKDDGRTCLGIGEPNGPQFTLSAAHEHAVVYRNGGYGEMTEGVGTLRASGGDVGGGTESIVVERIRRERER